MEDDSYSADDDSLDIASKCWKRVINTAAKVLRNFQSAITYDIIDTE